MTAAGFRERVEVHAAARPAAPALEDGRGRAVAWGDLPGRVDRLAGALGRLGPAPLGTLAGNGIGASLLELAAIRGGIPLVPLPGFFTGDQVRHAAATAGLAWILTDDPERVAATFPGAAPGPRVAGPLAAIRVGPGAPAPAGAERITFTSGTTGRPKGVRLRNDALLAVAASLAEATAMGPGDRHLALLPSAILLEGTGGLLRALLSGATAVLPPLEEVGLRGSTDLDPERLVAALSRHRATTTILMPEVLRGVVEVLERDPRAAPRDLRFAGVGGARVEVALLARAAALGLPVFEGYGLTEAGSVIALNLPGAERRGSAGRPLPHAEVRISPAGEVLVRGTTFTGYLGREEAPDAEGWWATGDLGSLDADGFLHLRGRRHASFSTSFGRNVDPAWVEEVLVDGTSIREACVLGEGRPGPVAVLVPAAEGADPGGEVAAVNRRLPDYARVRAWVAVREPFTRENGLRGPDGEPDRRAIEARHGARLAEAERGGSAGAPRERRGSPWVSTIG